MAGRPAGFSSDEDFSDDGFEVYSSNFPTKKSYKPYANAPKQREEPLDQKFFNAIRNGDCNIVAETVNKGINVNSVDNKWSALMYACFYSNVEVVKYLLEHGANVGFHVDFYTPLMGICNGRLIEEGDRVKCAELLLKNGIDIDMVDRYKTTALMLAAKEGLCKVVEKLIEHGSNVNNRDRNGWTALFFAVQYERIDIVEVLVNAKTNLRIKDLNEQTAYDLAISKELKDIAEKVYFEDPAKQVKLPPLINIKHITSVDDMLEEMPSINGSQDLSGFPSDVYSLLHGMNLQHLSYLFYRNKIQLGEFLVINDDRLKVIGIKLSFHREKILNSLKRFHLQRWLKSSIGYKSNYEKLKIFDSIKMMGNTVRHIHVIQSALLFLDQHRGKDGLSNEALDQLQKVTHQALVLENELNTVHEFAEQVDERMKLEPADLIEPKKTSKSKKGLLLKVCTITLIGVVIWKYKDKCSFLYK